MTIDGTVNKTELSLGILLVINHRRTYLNANTDYILLFFIGGFIIALITIFKKYGLQ